MLNQRMIAARRQVVQMLLGAAVMVLSGTVQAHAVTVGSLEIDHPYAVPTAPHQTEAMVYFRAIRNTGVQTEQLLGASTPVAQAVQLQEDGQPAAVIALPAHTMRALRHEQTTGLRLQGLQRPLLEGDRFAVRLHFAHAGQREVVVWVQRPRTPQASTHTH